MANENWIVKVLKFAFQSEIKTPLAFAYKVVPYLVAALIVILYAPVSEDLKSELVWLAFLSVLGMAALVFLFSWFRPKNLVYGELGHRAEHKVEFGTDTRILNREEASRLPPSAITELPLIEPGKD